MVVGLVDLGRLNVICGDRSVQRCIKAGIDCAGYNIKLGWSNPLTISKDNNALICLGSEENDGNSNLHFRDGILILLNSQTRCCMKI